MAQCGPLRHGGHLHHAEGDAYRGSEDQRDDDPLVLADLRVEERGDHGDRGGDLSDEHAAHRRDRRAQPLDSENKTDRRRDVCDIDELLQVGRGHDFLAALPVLNMPSMRSVMTKPPTMLLNEAATAINPRIVESRVSCRPAMMMAATTTMASNAFVRDINGVCNSGETRLISSNPRNAARMNTNRLEIKSAGIHSSLRFGSQRRELVNFTQPDVYNFSILGQQSIAHDFVLRIDLKFSFFHHVQKKRGDVFGVHLA